MEKRIYELISPKELVELKPDKDIYYVFSDDFLLPIENVTAEENRIGQKYLSLLGIDHKNTDELTLSFHAIELYNLFISISREKLEKKEYF